MIPSVAMTGCSSGSWKSNLYPEVNVNGKLSVEGVLKITRRPNFCPPLLVKRTFEFGLKVKQVP